MIYVAIRNSMTNCQDDDLMSLAHDLFGTVGGIVDDGHFAVTENSPTGMSVLVAVGKCYVYCSSLTTIMRALSDAEVQATIDSNSSGSDRIDLICVKVDVTVTANADADNVASIVVVKGTAGAGVPETPANHYKLAEITVANGATSIVTADITDSRVHAKIISDYITFPITPTSITTITGKTFDDELRLKQIETPADPETGYNKLYFKDDGKLYYLDENSVETEVGASGGGSVDGWTPVTDIPTYASASTVNVPSGAALIYKKGDKYKFTQHGVVKYFYIITVADTLLTITAGSDNVVENTNTYPITEPSYSHQENPVGFPAYFNTTALPFVITYLDDGAGGVKSSATSKFYITGPICHHFATVTGCRKKTTNNYIQFSFPANLPALATLGVGSGMMSGINVPFNIDPNHYIMSVNNISDNTAIAGIYFGESYLY